MRAGSGFHYNAPQAFALQHGSGPAPADGGRSLQPWIDTAAGAALSQEASCRQLIVVQTAERMSRTSCRLTVLRQDDTRGRNACTACRTIDAI